MAFNGANLTLVTSPAKLTGPKFFVYVTTDTVATVSAASYFAPFANSDLQTLQEYAFSVGDQIQCTCSDGIAEIEITDISPITSAAQAVAVANITNAQIAANAAIAFSKLAALPSAEILVGSGANVATARAVTGDVTIGNTGITAIGAGKVTKAMLAATVRPSGMIVFAGNEVTVGGAAAEAFAIPGIVAATDLAFVQIVDNGTGNVTALQAVCTNDTLTVTFSADPQNDTVFNYQIVRATA